MHHTILAAIPNEATENETAATELPAKANGRDLEFTDLLAALDA